MPSLLIIDDEIFVRMTLAANLELAGFEVVEACNVTMATEILRSRKVDAVVTDVRMPERDGLAGLDDLRAICPGLPAIFMTGSDPDQVLTLALAKGAYTVLPKPFPVERLVEVIKRAIAAPTVLVVDDDPERAERAASSLEVRGIRAQIAAGCLHAMERLRDGEVDVCVMGLGGIGVTELLDHVSVEHPHICVLGIAPVDAMVAEATYRGAYHCLKHPFEPEALAFFVGRARAEQAAGRYRR